MDVQHERHQIKMTLRHNWTTAAPARSVCTHIRGAAPSDAIHCSTLVRFQTSGVIETGCDITLPHLSPLDTPRRERATRTGCDWAMIVSWSCVCVHLMNVSQTLTPAQSLFSGRVLHIATQTKAGW